MAALLPLSPAIVLHLEAGLPPCSAWPCPLLQPGRWVPGEWQETPLPGSGSWAARHGSQSVSGGPTKLSFGTLSRRGSGLLWCTSLSSAPGFAITSLLRVSGYRTFPRPFLKIKWNLTSNHGLSAEEKPLHSEHPFVPCPPQVPPSLPQWSQNTYEMGAIISIIQWKKLKPW